MFRESAPGLRHELEKSGCSNSQTVAKTGLRPLETREKDELEVPEEQLSSTRGDEMLLCFRKYFLFSSVVFSCMLRTSLSVVQFSSLLHADAHTDFCDGVTIKASAVVAQVQYSR